MIYMDQPAAGKHVLLEFMRASQQRGALVVALGERDQNLDAPLLRLDARRLPLARSICRPRHSR